MIPDTEPAGYHQPGILLPLTTGTPTTGLWCETCLLPSRSEIPVYALGPDGPTQIGIVKHCDGHQA